jgi:hypothetical protein
MRKININWVIIRKFVIDIKEDNAIKEIITCPEIMLIVIRRNKVKGRIKNLTNSIKIINGARSFGQV